MFLQWYPGHMTRASRMIEQEVKLCDGVIFVLDARAPLACLNPKIFSVFKNKPVLYLLNKSDLVEQKDLLSAVEEFKRQGKLAIPVEGTSAKSAKLIYDKIGVVLSQVKDRYALKGVKRPLRVMVAGLPNTGKSTVINALIGKKGAKTGDKAGVTRDKQWLKIKDLELLDTPGTTPPSFENQRYALFLAFLGSLNDDILDFEELSVELIKYLCESYAGRIESVYGVDTNGKEPYEILGDIAAKKGALKKGGEPDYLKAANMFINDLRKGKIGKIYFK